MIAFATPDWLWFLLGTWFGTIVLFVVILFFNWPEDRPQPDDLTWDEFIEGDDKEAP